MLIAIDHGNKQMKTIHCPPFVSGLTESITRPFGSDILEYQDKFYTLSNQRIPYKRDKTEDDRFFILWEQHTRGSDSPRPGKSEKGVLWDTYLIGVRISYGI